MSESTAISSTDPMVVADPLAAFEKDGMLKILAPAKTNLYLNVGSKRDDGFHEVKTILHALSIHDVLHMDYESDYTKVQDIEVLQPEGLLIEVAMKGREGLEVPEIAPEDNLVYQAIERLAKKLGRTKNERFKVRVEKHIPHQAGLGGGSSDAAAALIGAAHFWGIDAHTPEVAEVAQSLGSDVSFFLYGGCGFFSGKGEVYEHALEPMKKSVVLVRPEGAISTADAYRIFDESPCVVPDEVAQKAYDTCRAEELALSNNLTGAAIKLLPEIAEIETWGSVRSGIEQVLLSGSGSAVCLIANSFEEACRVSSEAKKRGWWARVTSFSSLGAAIIPKK